MFDLDILKTIQNYQRSNFYRAKVVSLDDPLKLNRIQIMIFGLTDDIPNESQPWCEFQSKDGIITYPSVDDVIWVFFEGGDIFRPVYLGTIYAGKNLDCEKGWESFLTGRPTKPTDADSYKAALRVANNIEDPQKLAAKDVHMQFTDCILPEDDPLSLAFKGKNEKTEYTFDLKDVADTATMTFNSTHPRYRSNFPSTFVKSPQKMYPWYVVEDVPEGKDWRSVLGGWTFYTETELQQALASFPDNLRHTNYRRYLNWVDFTSEADGELDSRQPPVLTKRPYSWKFIPSLPNWWWHPEMQGADMFDPRHTYSFPFGKMNVKTHKYWKQHTFLSHDGKSAIELDDNDNYERLRIDFNYGAGGLEFSRVGINGIEMWTDGIIEMRAHGNLGNGEGGFASRNAIDSSWICKGCNLRLRTDASALLEGKKFVRVTAQGDAELRSKNGTARVYGLDGVFIGSMNGNDYQSKPGLYKPAGSKFFTGIPVISAPAGEGCPAQMHGNFLMLPGPKISDAAAAMWMTKFNAAMMVIRDLCQAISGSDIAGFGMIGAMGTISAAAKGAAVLAGWNLEGEACDMVKLAGAWDGIQVQGCAGG
jgi:hypothetical protein